MSDTARDTRVTPTRRIARGQISIALSGVALAAMSLGASGCSRLAERAFPVTCEKPVTPLPAFPLAAPVVRLLNRAGFGPAPGDVAAVAAQGIGSWIEEQLAAPLGPDADSTEAHGLQVRLANIDVLTTEPYELRDLPEDEVMLQLQQAQLLRAVYSRWQLRERLVDFWTNHFNLYARKTIGEYLVCNLIARDTQTVVRAHALGRFPDMLKASAKSPAMLGYLDNQLNRAGDAGKNANENYARELLELHTLGIGGGYTQKDVQEVARCLTGWTIEDGFLKDKGAWAFKPDLHDSGEKHVLGVTIPAGGGEGDGERVLEILAHHPSTARFIGGKLARYFHGEPTEATVAETAAIYQKTEGDIGAMVRYLLTCPAFDDTPPVVKRPLDFCVSVLRATNADTDGKSGVLEHLAKMGQSPYQWPMPDGYPDRTVAWTGSLLARWNFALALAEDRVAGTAVVWEDEPQPQIVMERLLSLPGDAPDARSLMAVLEGHSPREQVALLLSAPQFQWR